MSVSLQFFSPSTEIKVVHFYSLKFVQLHSCQVLLHRRLHHRIIPPVNIHVVHCGSISAVLAPDPPAPSITLRELCEARVPEQIIRRAEEIGFVKPTDIQRESLPLLLSGQDCIIHAQTGSGKTLAYLLLVFSAINFRRSAVQALIVVPTRELGIQVTKVARMLAAKPTGSETEHKACTIMALLDGGMLKRQKSWLKAEPPQIVVASISSLCQMLEKHILKLDALSVMIIDEVDFMFNSSKQVSYLRKLLTSHSSIDRRQTIFASASIPQHHRFLYDCIQQKWTKKDVAHIHLNPVHPMPGHFCHNYVICSKKERFKTLLMLIKRDSPRSAIVFVGEQSERSKRIGEFPSTTLLFEFLKTSYNGCLEVLLLEEEMNFNARATSLSDLKEGRYLLVATDIASRGFDLPQTTHIYNFDLPRTAVDYLHRAGRTGRMPFSKDLCCITSLIKQEERFVLQKYENELLFQCEEVILDSLQHLDVSTH